MKVISYRCDQCGNEFEWGLHVKRRYWSILHDEAHPDEDGDFCGLQCFQKYVKSDENKPCQCGCLAHGGNPAMPIE